MVAVVTVRPCSHIPRPIHGRAANASYALKSKHRDGRFEFGAASVPRSGAEGRAARGLRSRDLKPISSVLGVYSRSLSHLPSSLSPSSLAASLLSASNANHGCSLTSPQQGDFRQVHTGTGTTMITINVVTWVADCMNDKTSNVQIELVDNSPFHLKGSFQGPEDTPYQGGHFDIVSPIR